MKGQPPQLEPPSYPPRTPPVWLSQLPIASARFPRLFCVIGVKGAELWQLFQAQGELWSVMLPVSASFSASKSLCGVWALSGSGGYAGLWELLWAVGFGPRGPVPVRVHD